jgi:hypothetical protein
MVLGWKTRKKYVVFFLLTGVCTFILSLGPYLFLDDMRKNHIILPYYYLYQIAPIMQSVRVPARLSIMVIFSLSALAGIGLSRILTKKYALLLTTLIAILFLTEVWQLQTPSVSLSTGSNIPAVYTWLAKQPDSAIIAELPFRPLANIVSSMEDQLLRPYQDIKDNDGYALETYRIYFSTYHRKRMLNGYSGFFPQVYHDQATILQNFPSEESIAMLEKQRVTYVIVHTWQYTDKSVDDIKQELTTFENVQLREQFGDDYVYEIIQK